MIYGIKEAGPLAQVIYYAQSVSLLAGKSDEKEIQHAMEELNRAYEAAYGHRSDRTREPGIE